jgi:hypothetical protein
MSVNSMADPTVNLDLLLKLRLVIARVGELDLGQWWNTKGQLGQVGATVLRRGFPRTYRFAQARSVFAVAAHRCKEVFDPPGCVTLWRLDEETEEAFDAQWESWIDSSGEWDGFFDGLQRIERLDVAKACVSRGLIVDGDVDILTRLKRSAEGRAIQLPGLFSGVDQDLRLLALGFARSELGALSVPYMRRADA